MEREGSGSGLGCFFVIIVGIITLITFVFPHGCNRGPKIFISNIQSDCDISYFRGIKPDITFDELVEIAGEPSEYYDEGRGDEAEHNPVYYFKDGKIICHWTGYKRDEIGMVEYIPFSVNKLYLDDFVKIQYNKDDVTEKSKGVSVYKGDMWLFTIKLEDREIKSIEYWNVKQ